MSGGILSWTTGPTTYNNCRRQVSLSTRTQCFKTLLLQPHAQNQPQGPRIIKVVWKFLLGKMYHNHDPNADTSSLCLVSYSDRRAGMEDVTRQNTILKLQTLAFSA